MEPRIEVRDTTTRDKLKPIAYLLKPDPCKCGKSEFLCYPADGECPCGTVKHHVHCFCGGVSQWG